MNSILIANRGEIAVRVARTCRDLGVDAIAVHSEVDADALHVRVADRAVALPGRTARETYLDEKAILLAADEAGADAIHPGYGFLSENARFAEAVVSAGLTFVGPRPVSIRAMGDKVIARRTAAAAGVRSVPGTLDPLHGVDEVLAFAADHGYPLALKAAAGGGGRGMRVVDREAEIERALAAAQREALAAFGDDRLYVERYLASPRHVEVQLIADQHGTCVALGDRDCSIQRRHQKLIEEAPAPGIAPDIQVAMAGAAVAVAQAVDYVGVGTVEFLYESGAFYFLEMNTRLQVEHTVTEAVLGLDLVAEQLRVARGEPLGFAPGDLQPRGHAIECRINAEDAAGGRFLPSAGRIAVLDAPYGHGLRWDSGYESGDEVSDLYDNLVGKLVAWGPDRQVARRRAVRALCELRIEGVVSNAPALAVALREQSFVDATHSTRWVDLHADVLPEALPFAPAADDGRSAVVVGGRTYHLPTRRAATPAPRAATASGAAPADSRGNGTVPAADRPPARRPSDARAEPGRIVASMQGRVLRVHVGVGTSVEAGEVVCVLEAMKMENEILADVAGSVAELAVAEGQAIAPGDLLMRLEAR